MGTLKNCYDILGDVREALNEYSDDYVQGTDTTGTYQNRYLLRKINEAQRDIYNILMLRPEVSEEFVEEIAIVGVNSVYTLPPDYGQMVYFKNDEGLKVTRIKQSERRLANDTGSEQHYYRKGNTLVLDATGITKTYTLIYHRKPRDITTGSAAAGGAASITFGTEAKMIADYYNGMDIEDITAGFIDTITDYTAGRVATITGTAVTADFYGIVPDMPEMFHEFISVLAVMLIKTESPVSQEKPTASSYTLFNKRVTDAIAAYTGNEDVPHEEFFMDDDAPSMGGVW